MKKIALLAFVAASIFGVSNTKADEVTYVEDCSQGLLINRMQDNWFITAEGGANTFFSNHDRMAKFRQRIGASANLYVGKWFTPVWGFRFGVSGIIARGATNENGLFRDQNQGPMTVTGNGELLYPERVGMLGPKVELMLNLTNWLCGYNPERIYNAVFHGGGGGYWTFYHGYHYGHDASNSRLKWHNADNRTLFAEVGLQNNFRVSKHFDIFLDVSATITDYTNNDVIHDIKTHKDMAATVALQAGFTYKFNKTDWNCPVTAVCPSLKYTDAEGDALTARLANAENKINELQVQLNVVNAPEQNCDCVIPLVTIYYPINVSSLSNREVTLLQNLAITMKENPDKKYILTGWADNYTGNDAINTRLRNERVNGVYQVLRKAGVPASQLQTRIDAQNLTDYGFKGAQFDRAVTIIEAQ